MPEPKTYTLALLADLTTANNYNSNAWNYLAYALHEGSYETGYCYLHDGGAHEADPDFRSIFIGGDSINRIYLHIRAMPPASTTLSVLNCHVVFNKDNTSSNDNSPFIHESSNIALVRNRHIEREDNISAFQWKKCQAFIKWWSFPNEDTKFPWIFKSNLDASFEFSVELDIKEEPEEGAVKTTKFKFDPKWQLSAGPTDGSK